MTYSPDNDPILKKIEFQSVPSAPQIKNMADLFFTEFPPIRWVIPDFLPEGLAILSGPPKIGKSWLVMNLCIAGATGGYALGRFKVEQGEVLLLSLEDNERRLQGRLKTCLNGAFCDISKFHATTTWKKLDQGGLVQLATWLDQHNECKLVVIDTIQKIKPQPKNNSGNAYENDYDAYGGLQRLALKHRCCILVIHHNRKSDSKNNDDPLEQISGSIGITGSMDTILMLRRPRGATGAILTATGRDIAEAQYGLTFDGEVGTWIVSGKPEELNLGDNAHEIIELLKRYALKLTPAEVSERFPLLSTENVKKTLQRLFAKGILANSRGKYSYVSPVSPVSPSDRDTHRDNVSLSNAENEPFRDIVSPVSPIPTNTQNNYTKYGDTQKPQVSLSPGDTGDTKDTMSLRDTRDIYISVGGIDEGPPTEEGYLDSLMEAA